MGAVGHSIEDCVTFKRNVLDLIDQNHIHLEPHENANIVANPLPNHENDKQVGAIEANIECYKKPLINKGFYPVLSGHAGS